jgi:hypothetical protein
VDTFVADDCEPPIFNGEINEDAAPLARPVHAEPPEHVARALKDIAPNAPPAARHAPLEVDANLA